MNAQIASLIINLLLFAVGLYLFLFARGIVKFSDPERAKRAAVIRQENGRWMRIAGLALAAVMGLNVAVGIYELVVG